MRKASVVGAAVAALGLSSLAFGLPWDIDMADGQQKKAYAIEMQPLPAGVVVQPSVLSPDTFVPNAVRGSEEGEALAAPFEDTAAVLAKGKHMYDVYCTPCHADGSSVGPVGQPGRVPGVVTLAGPSGVLGLRSDGWLYLTVRNGGPIMPGYGWAMTDDEMWSLVRHLRTFDNATYTPQDAAEGSNP